MSTGLFAWIEKRKIEGRERKQAVQLACSPLRRRLQEWCCVESKSWTASYSQSFLWQVPLVKKSERKKEWTSRRFRKGKVNFVFMSPADRNRQIEWSGNKKQTHFYLDRRKLKVASTRRLLATATPLHSTAVHSTATAASLSLSAVCRSRGRHSKGHSAEHQCQPHSWDRKRSARQQSALFDFDSLDVSPSFCPPH